MHKISILAMESEVGPLILLCRCRPLKRPNFSPETDITHSVVWDALALPMLSLRSGTNGNWLVGSQCT